MTDLKGLRPHCGNPIVPGYYADPSLVQADGIFYMYATLDPWGGDTLGCWESADFKNWTFRTLNWPTKKACTSATSGGAHVWAPSVVRGTDGLFYMYVSVGSEIWVGVARHPLGPWKNALGDRPLIPGNYRSGFHMIDAEAFIDDDGSAYLYWGSGLNWENGRCWAVRLNADMVSFSHDAVQDVTPAPTYFEAPFMIKRDGRYYLMYSNGVTIRDTYQVHYAVGDDPLGPFREPASSPILVTDHDIDVLSPGHHAVFEHDGQTYILYHRHSMPFDPELIGRQICVDRLDFTADGEIRKVAPTHDGPPLVQGRDAGRGRLDATATASSRASATSGPERVLDDNYATRWAAAAESRGGWLRLDLGGPVAVKRQELRFEYAWKCYRFTLQSSVDGEHWQTLDENGGKLPVGSPYVMETAETARYLRLVFPTEMRGADISVIEWSVF